MTGGHGSLLLGQERDLGGQLGDGPATPAQDAQHLERGDDPVARGALLEDDHVTALLAAEDGARNLHPLEDVLVADGGPDDLAAGRLDRHLETAVRQDRHDEAAPGELAPGQPVEGEQADQLVAVDDVPGGVDRDAPVGIAVEGEADVGAPLGHGRRQRRRGGRPATEIDVQPVGLGEDDLDPGPGRGEDVGRHDAARAVGAVEHDPEIGRDRPGQADPVLAVARQQAAGIDRPAQLGVAHPAQVARPPDELLELVLDVVVELEPGRVEHLQAVVLGRVVGGGDHDPRGEVARAGQVGQGRRRNDPDPMDVDAQTGRPADDGGHEHVTRAAGVLADDDRPTGAGQSSCRRPTEIVGDGRLELDVGDAPDAVGTEQTRHLGSARGRRGRGRRRRRDVLGDAHRDLGRARGHELDVGRERDLELDLVVARREAIDVGDDRQGARIERVERGDGAPDGDQDRRAGQRVGPVVTRPGQDDPDRVNKAGFQVFQSLGTKHWAGKSIVWLAREQLQSNSAMFKTSSHRKWML